MILGFKARFVPFILDGSKTHTIRATRKNPPRTGEACHCYTGLRTKACRLLGRWRCVKVESILIHEEKLDNHGRHRMMMIAINGEHLTLDECRALAWRDGFRSASPRLAFAEMIEYWEDRRFPFVGHLIHWNFNERCAAPKRAGRN